jgi:adenylosuccinate synthase
MHKFQAVIGAGWGDEGKGMAVDGLSAALASDGHAVTVVRSNGGAQAGHGVTLADGRHHVFHHIGSGSFTGASTHLSRFFVSHPMLLFQELRDLEKLGVTDLVIEADPLSAITTPWDMAINQAMEMARGNGKHGSCGLGFGETLQRMENGPQLQMRDLSTPGLQSQVEKIMDVWMPQRLEDLGIDIPDGVLGEVLEGSTEVFSHFMNDLERFSEMVSVRSDAYLRTGDAIVFEGAQGLQLDMDLGEFPHVTRSHTGMKNVSEICELAGIDRIEVNYMTRAYATRHGAGPFPHDQGTMPMDGLTVVDKTNVDNEWQDAIRYAPLDLRILERIIDADMDRSQRQGLTIDAGIGVTCVDQIDETVGMKILDFGDDEQIIGQVDKEGVAHVISGQTGQELKLVSRGPTRETLEISGRTEVSPVPG